MDELEQINENDEQMAYDYWIMETEDAENNN